MAKIMEIKCGRRKFTVTEKDMILDNGVCYQLITQYYFDGYSRLTPMVAKSTFNKLLKSGQIRLSPKKYKSAYGKTYDLYRFVTEKEN